MADHAVSMVPRQSALSGASAATRSARGPAGSSSPASALGGLLPASVIDLAVSGRTLVPVAVICIILALVIPLPTFLLDILLTANITLSTIILLVSMFIRKPAEFSIFPTTLLLTTLFRLALNVSSSRLILINGSHGTSAAGEVIQSFGNFVVGGNYVIGIVIFLVLISIQYVVINHGAVRISEVTARFTLDALPGKQMSIDADLNAGLINESEAKLRRKMLSAEAEFYGAMDGATRFTQRDAIASIIITAINIFAGFLIGVFQHGLTLVAALETYTVLTIGDGLVTVIPALMISISGGLIVTRASSEEEMGDDIQHQVFGTPQPLILAGVSLLAMSLFPGLPKLPFLMFGAAVAYVGYRAATPKQSPQQAALATKSASPKEDLEALIKVDPITMEVGLGLVHLVEGGADSPLLRRISAIRKQVALDLGFVLPPVRVADNVGLQARQYTVLIKGVEVSRYELPVGCDLAIPSGNAAAPPQSTPTSDPAFGISAYWVPSNLSEKLRNDGYTVVDQISVVGTHLGELVRRHFHEVLSRQDTKKILDRVAEDHPRLIEDLVPKTVSLSTVQRIFQNLLRERVSIRDAASILEALSEAAAMTRNQILMTEFVRQSLRRSLVRRYLDDHNTLRAFILDAGLEQGIERAIEHGEFSSHLNLPPQLARDVRDAIGRSLGASGSSTVLITGSAVRYFIRQLVESFGPQITVLSHAEIPDGVTVSSLGVVKGNQK